MICVSQVQTDGNDYKNLSLDRTDVLELGVISNVSQCFWAINLNQSLKFDIFALGSSTCQSWQSSP